MCLIIHKKQNAVIPQWLLESASEINPDGFGIAWRDPNGGQFHSFRSVYDDWVDQLEMASLLLKHIGSKPEAIIHFRMRTHGSVDKKNCHPIKCSKWLFFHNGVIRGFGNDTKSDTVEFAELILTPLLKDQKTLSQTLRIAIENMVFGSRIVLISPLGAVYRIPERWYELSDGVYLSNTYAWRNPKQQRKNKHESVWLLPWRNRV